VAQGILLSPHQQGSQVLDSSLDKGATELCVSSFRIDIATMLQDKTSLESISIRNRWNMIETIKAEEYMALVTVLQRNTTLKTLEIYRNTRSLQLTDDEDKQMASLLKKNFALESLPDNKKERARDVGGHLATEWNRTLVSN
jgi:hypothetical protein